jgi:hypothetical protein
MALPEPAICNRALTTLPLVMPKIYYGIDPVQAYRYYYIQEKAAIAKWTKRKVPTWFITDINKDE